MLFRQPVLPGRIIAAARLKAEGIIRAHRRMGCTAVGIAPRDMAGGLEFLQDREGLPWISLNLVDDGGKPLFPPGILARAGDLRIRILGLTGPIRKTNIRQNGYRTLDWQTTLPAALEQARQEADMIILLSSYPFQVNQQIARSERGIALILQAGVMPGNMAPRVIGSTLICQTGSRGKYLGVLDLDWRDGTGWSMSGRARRELLQQRLNRIDRQLARIRNNTSAAKAETDRDSHRLQAARAAIEDELRTLPRGKNGQEKGSVYRNRFVALKTTLPRDRQVEAIVQQTLRRVNELNRRQLAEQQRQRKDQQRARQRLSMLTGSVTCGSCHQRQAAFWRRTRHAGAWQTLAMRKRQFDRDCQSCHVTLPSGIMTATELRALPLNLPVELRSVGCEACHGPGGKHAAAPAENRLRRPDASTCTRCHQSDHDPAFSFADKLPLVRCPRSESH